MSEGPFINVAGLTKVFKGGAKPALDNLDVKMERGQTVGLVGPDGSGKTTLMRLLIGLLSPDRGTVTVNGFDSRAQADKIQAISGYMPQKFGLYEDLTVLENMSLYADLRGAPKPERKARFA